MQRRASSTQARTEAALVGRGCCLWPSCWPGKAGARRSRGGVPPSGSGLLTQALSLELSRGNAPLHPSKLSPLFPRRLSLYSSERAGLTYHTTQEPRAARSPKCASLQAALRGPRGFLEMQDRAGRAGASERQRPDRSEGGLCLHTLCEGDLIQSKPVIPSGGGGRGNANKGPTARGPALGGRPASLSPHPEPRGPAASRPARSPRAQSPGRQLGAASPPPPRGGPRTRWSGFPACWSHRPRGHPRLRRGRSQGRGGAPGPAPASQSHGAAADARGR